MCKKKRSLGKELLPLKYETNLPWWWCMVKRGTLFSKNYMHYQYCSLMWAEKV